MDMNTPLDLPLTDSRLSETITSSPNTSEPISTRPNVDSSALVSLPSSSSIAVIEFIYKNSAGCWSHL